MQVIIQGQHLDVGEALQTYITEKLEDTSTRYFNHAIQGTVHLSREANGFRANITLAVGNGIVLKASATDSAGPYPAFDQANTKLTTQLRRYKDRLRDHHQNQGSKGDIALGQPANEYMLQQGEEDAAAHGEGGDSPVVLAELPTNIQTLSVSDAVMRMDLADLPALLFKNAAHGQINMVYRRADGHIGWVDPQIEASGEAAEQKTRQATD